MAPPQNNYELQHLTIIPHESPRPITFSRDGIKSLWLKPFITSKMAEKRAAQIAGHLNYPKGMLAGQVAIITGSGQGIGAEAARLFANEGAKVVVQDIDAREQSTYTKYLPIEISPLTIIFPTQRKQKQ